MTKAIAAEIHSLADPAEKGGKIWFIHADGKQHFYYSVVNIMSGSRLSGFDNRPPTVDQSLAEVKKVFANIRTNAHAVVREIGDFKDD